MPVLAAELSFSPVDDYKRRKYAAVAAKLANRVLH